MALRTITGKCHDRIGSHVLIWVTLVTHHKMRHYHSVIFPRGWYIETKRMGPH